MTTIQYNTIQLVTMSTQNVRKSPLSHRMPRPRGSPAPPSLWSCTRWTARRTSWQGIYRIELVNKFWYIWNICRKQIMKADLHRVLICPAWIINCDFVFFTSQIRSSGCRNILWGRSIIDSQAQVMEMFLSWDRKKTKSGSTASFKCNCNDIYIWVVSGTFSGGPDL